MTNPNAALAERLERIAVETGQHGPTMLERLATKGLVLVSTERLATALRATRSVDGVAHRYGSFNDAYYEGYAARVLAALDSLPKETP